MAIIEKLTAIANAIRQKTGTQETMTLAEMPQKIAEINTAPSHEPYTGAYSVAPDFTGQALATRGKVMDDDVTVQPIAVSRVTNTQGGRTIYIGGNFNG